VFSSYREASLRSKSRWFLGDEMVESSQGDIFENEDHVEL